MGHPDPFRESVRRLQAYVAAGADVLFAPGPQTPAEIEALVAAVAPRPLNLLVVRDIGLRVDEIAALGVRRISVGGALALAAWTGFMRAAQTLKSEGSFAGLASLVPYAEINGLFATDLAGSPAARQRPPARSRRRATMNDETVKDRQEAVAPARASDQSGGATDTTDCRRQRTRRSAHHGGDRVRAAALRAVSVQSRDAFVAVR